MNISQAINWTRLVIRRQHKALSTQDTQLLLQAIRNVGGYPTTLIARLLYGCGLRVSEPLNLRIKDINLERHRIWEGRTNWNAFTHF